MPEAPTLLPVDERRRADQLNDEQRRVVAHDAGPLLVLAGPGSGKTRVLVERFVRLVLEQRARPSEILVLAFNTDAAAEMNRRVTERLGVAVPNCNVPCLRETGPRGAGLDGGTAQRVPASRQRRREVAAA